MASSKSSLIAESRPGEYVLKIFIDAINKDLALERIIQWSKEKSSGCVCLCNVHSVVTALDNSDLSNALQKSDLVLPDGAPIAWMLRNKGFQKQRRIAGPDLMLNVCNKLQDSDAGIFLFGSSENTLNKLHKNLKQSFPHLTISGTRSPGFGDWSEQEEGYINDINHSGASIIFIGLGCPKQEIWMADNREKVHGVMLGVGAAFDFHAGTVKRAPKIYQKFGLEWLYRLLSEPRRLWKRYLITNTRFIWRSMIELLTSKVSKLLI